MDDKIYQSLFENSFSVMLLIHPDSGVIIDANRAASHFYGYDMKKLKQMNIQDINLMSEAELRKEMAMAKAEKRHCFNFRHRCANGEIRDVEVFCGPILLNNENVLYSIIHDISDRKRAEEQFQLERQFSDSLISSLPGIMYVFTQLGRFTRWNRNLELVSGYSSEQIRELGPLDFIAPEDREKVKKAILTVFREGRVAVEAGLCTKSGEIIPYLFSGYKMVRNEVNYLVGTGTDISGLVKSEKEKEILIGKLQDNIAKIKKLSGFLPICASCKKIRDDKGYWNEIEAYIVSHSEAHFSHGLCRECERKLYGDEAWYANIESDESI